MVWQRSVRRLRFVPSGSSPEFDQIASLSIDCDSLAFITIDRCFHAKSAKLPGSQVGFHPSEQLVIFGNYLGSLGELVEVVLHHEIYRKFISISEG